MNEGFDLSIDISEFVFSKESFHELATNKWVRGQWPLVYFIQNKERKLAYVGESTNATIRIASHLVNEKRSVLNKISIIGSDKFNKSATLDIESKLIQYISSEGSFSLQNANNGLSHHNYYQQELYGNLFKKVWERLIEKRIVTKSLEEIQNSDFFKYSPYKALNQDQFNSVLEIIESLNKKSASHIFVKGSAGTGKTILATYLIKLLMSKYEELNVEDVESENYQEIQLVREFKKKYPSPSIALIIAMTPLRETLQKVFDKIPGLNSNMVISPTDTFKRKYDIVIVDEAHRLRQRRNISWMGVFTKNNSRLGLGNEGTELEWILANSTHQIFFYDSAQSIKPSDIPQNRFDALLNKPSTIQLELKSQMRVTAGADYIAFVDNLLNCRLNETLQYQPVNYDIRVFDSLPDLYSDLTKKEKEYKLCRLVAGYSWPWETNKENPKQNYDIEIDGLKFCWNRTDKDWISTKNSFQEIGCIHTTQGYDLNYVGVIFGKEIKYNPELNTIEISPENYFDRNGKAGITDSNDLKDYIINIYKTIMYRGIKGAFIYACDENLRDYLLKYIPSNNSKSPLKVVHVAEEVNVTNRVPFYDISVAAGKFSESGLQGNADNWVELPPHIEAKEGMFVCKVVGESMNKKIPNGALCLFRRDEGGSREGKIVLVQHHKIQEADFGSGYTVKLYHSEKSFNQATWSHKKIVLKSKSNLTGYQNIELGEDETERLHVIGIFDRVLE